ncbi:type VI secretion system contractile sheath small subunit [Vibrio sp. S4M6]|uniref:type VI secretion system contractile sheath small subunit n=1 Tax=Vibrio sinus TaxID=2946865 RepID=UPI00202A4EDD|nr:type VI secretion system contractile sheath small subunit [Vibrio sinus]MCL9780273.1 type VI secretion system contractile sheath small subunit [Vibrio sinus]
MSVNGIIPKSRFMIAYDTRVNGELKKGKELPFKVLVLGDFSSGLSNDQNVALEVRKIRSLKSGIDMVLKDMDICLNIRIPDVMNHNEGALVAYNIKVDSIKSFQPESIMKNIPKINNLLKCKSMLTSFEKDIENSRDIKRLMDSIFSDSEALDKLKKNIPNLEKFIICLQNK